MQSLQGLSDSRGSPDPTPALPIINRLLPLHLLYPFYGPSFLFRQKGILTISCVQTPACVVLSAWNASPLPAVFLDVIVFKAQHKPGLLHEEDLPARLSFPFLPSDSKAPVVWSPC